MDEKQFHAKYLRIDIFTCVQAIKLCQNPHENYGPTIWPVDIMK